MIYLVTNQLEMFPTFKHISVEESIDMFKNDWRLQIDSETTGLCPQGKINDLLCFQIGNDNDQVVIDTTTANITRYKELLESKLLVGANLKFDLMFLYNYDIHPLKVFDVMITEQVIHLGWPRHLIGLSEEQIIQYMSVAAEYDDWDDLPEKKKSMIMSYKIPDIHNYIKEHCGCSLKALAYRYCDLEMDKSVRGEIIYTGLTDRVIIYAADDVKHLFRIMDKQMQVLKNQNMTGYAKIENNFVPVCAYVEWCGIYLNPVRWGIKMRYNNRNLLKALEDLDNWFYQEAERNHNLKKQVQIGKKTKKDYLLRQDLQGDLFLGFNTKPTRSFDWSQTDYVIAVAEILGFNVNTIDKKTKKIKKSVEENLLKTQKGINDDFLKYYFAYQEQEKEVTGYGQNYLDAINPNTGRLHPTWSQIGTISGRMTNKAEKLKDLMKVKKLGRDIESMNIQVLPKSFLCRESFTNQLNDSLIAACDFSAIEAKLGAMIYNDDMMLKTFDNGWDSHSVAAKLCFPEELKDIDVTQIKKLRPDLRQKSKAPEFACQFGGSAKAIASQLGCSEEDAQQIYDNYMSGYSGMKEFQKRNGNVALQRGFIPCTYKTGGKIFWWDHCFWLKEEEEFHKEGFWDEYRMMKAQNPRNKLVRRVKMHMQAKSKWTQRMSLNGPTQHTGAEIFKRSATLFYYWVIENNLFNKVKFCACVHDELVIEFPKTRKDIPKILEAKMLEGGSEFYTRLSLNAEAAVAGHWVH